MPSGEKGFQTLDSGPYAEKGLFYTVDDKRDQLRMDKLEGLRNQRRNVNFLRMGI